MFIVHILFIHYTTGAISYIYIIYKHEYNDKMEFFKHIPLIKLNLGSNNFSTAH